MTLPIDLVFIDLEANSDRAQIIEHEIIEIGAVKVSGSGRDEFQTLVSNARQLSPEMSQLTGIQAGHLVGAPSLERALRELLEFVGDLPIVAHNGFGYDFPLVQESLHRCGLRKLENMLLDSLDLAHLVFPRAGRGVAPNSNGTSVPQGRSLDALAAWYDLDAPSDRHRAVADAELTIAVVMRMIDDLNADTPHRQLQRVILSEGHHAWSTLQLPQIGDDIDLVDVVPEGPGPVGTPAPTGEFAVGSTVAMFEQGGRLMGADREPRRQQADMARVVATAFAEGRRQLVEAPTGTGKTLAYLVPSIEYSRASGEPVIVAAHSKVLQDQIQASLLDLQKELGTFSYAVLKGRENYVSLEALEAELESPPPDEDSAFALALLVGWVAGTPSGDWNDLRTWAIDQRLSSLRLLKWKLRVEAAPGPPRSPLDARDFYRRALEATETAQVAVFNHALLVRQSDWMGRVRHLVVDEAHNLEESATNALSDDVSDSMIRVLCDTIYDEERRWGTLGRLADASDQKLGDEPIASVRSAVQSTRIAVDRFADPLIEYVRDRSGVRREEVATFGTAYRLRPGVDTARPSYARAMSAGRSLRDALRRIADALDELVVPGRLRGRYRRHRLEAEIARLGRMARSSAGLIDQVLGAFDADVWISIVDLRIEDGGWAWSLRRVPVSVDGELRDLWEATDASVLTSATLQVGGSFAFIVRALGLESAQSIALGTPFSDLYDQHLVVLTDYLPPPRGSLIDEFTQAESAEIARLVLLTSGRTMSLFTARSRLHEVKDHARPLVELYGYPLLAQGDEPAQALVERMRTDVPTSLLALRSFWEGVDIPGEALSQLIIEKVPFDSPTDPIVSARVDVLEELGVDPFSEYLVPRAAIRFAQGVGRLIRSPQDRGVTVVLDSRLRRPVPYRDAVLGSLVGPPRFCFADSGDEAYAAIAEHLGIELDASIQERINSVPTADPWAELDDLQLDRDDIRDERIIKQRLEVVRELFGFAEWRPGQLEAMIAFMSGNDVLAVLPTGSGKSITYQIPALLCPGVTIVVSPLIALMRDQTQNLRARGMTRVAAIHSGVPQSEQQAILRGARRGQYKLIYVSPERLWSPAFLAALQKIDVSRIAVDEAHCVSQWGHSFRPEYAAIPTAVTRIVSEKVPMMAATATATAKVRDEIRDELDLAIETVEVLRSPERPEILYYTERCIDFGDRDVKVVQILESFKGAASIVYVPKRKDAVRIANLLRSDGHGARAYHGGLPPAERLHVEDAFRHGEVDIVVATKAFGLGIDKPDIAVVVHLEMPATIEEYIQETGRVARGAQLGIGPANGTCVLLVTPRDCAIHRYFVKGAVPEIHDVKHVWDSLEVGTNYILPESLNADGAEMLSQGSALAVHYLTIAGAIARHPDVIWEGRVWVPGDAREMVDALAATDTELKRAATEILDLVDRLGSFDYQARTWSAQLNMDPPEVESVLLDLQARDILGFAAWRYAHNLERIAGIEPDWSTIDRTTASRRAHVRELADQARSFAHNDKRCRRVAILSYLGVEHDDHCESCDRCMSLPRPWSTSELTLEALTESIPVKRIVLRLIGDTQASRYSRRNIERALSGDEGRGPSSTPARLVEHPLFGRLSIFDRGAIGAVVAELIEQGLVEVDDIELKTADGTIVYQTLRLTEVAHERSR